MFRVACRKRRVGRAGGEKLRVEVVLGILEMAPQRSDQLIETARRNLGEEPSRVAEVVFGRGV
jgi:hypothetical protein